MFANIRLTRPLAVFDLETTGTDTKTDRIVEISILRIEPDGSNRIKTVRVNPGIPIPAEVSALHGITDADVADKPPFRSYARAIVQHLDGCDLCGFNIRGYDLPLLIAELRRAGVELPLEERAVVDPLKIFHDRERRDLTGALRFYCQMEHEGAHGAEADVIATVAVLDAQVARYRDLPRTIDGLHATHVDPDAIDFDGKFRRVDGRIVFNFGKYMGQDLDSIAASKPDYLNWILQQDFYDDVKTIVRRALARPACQDEGCVS